MSSKSEVSFAATIAWGLSYRVAGRGEQFHSFDNQEEAEDAMVAALCMKGLRDLRFYRMKRHTIDSGRFLIRHLRNQ